MRPKRPPTRGEMDYVHGNLARIVRAVAARCSLEYRATPRHRGGAIRVEDSSLHWDLLDACVVQHLGMKLAREFPASPYVCIDPWPSRMWLDADVQHTRLRELLGD